jgi:hypothetical protein
MVKAERIDYIVRDLLALPPHVERGEWGNHDPRYGVERIEVISVPAGDVDVPGYRIVINYEEPDLAILCREITGIIENTERARLIGKHGEHEQLSVE